MSLWGFWSDQICRPTAAKDPFPRLMGNRLWNPGLGKLTPKRLNTSGWLWENYSAMRFHPNRHLSREIALKCIKHDQTLSENLQIMIKFDIIHQISPASILYSPICSAFVGNGKSFKKWPTSSGLKTDLWNSPDLIRRHAKPKSLAG